MSITRTTSAVALAMVLAACSDAPTSAPAASSTIAPTAATAERKARPIPSTQVTNVALTDHATGAVVGSFTGTATLQHVAVEGRSIIGTLLMNGTAIVNGATVPVNQVVQSVLYTSPSAADATAAAAAAPLAIGSCPILNLAIGDIHLDLLGLVVDLSAINLDIVAQSGPGNLLGNLLCAVVGLLDGPTGGALGNALTNLLNTINGILSGL